MDTGSRSVRLPLCSRDGRVLKHIERTHQVSLITQARVDALLSHSLFFIERTFFRSASRTWLEPRERDEARANVYMPFLRSMEHALQDDKVVEAIWHRSQGTQTAALPSATACLVASALTMLTDIMPYSLARTSTLESKTDGRAVKTLASQFPACDKLVTSVEACPGVKAWLKGVTDEWSLSPPFAARLVREAAGKWDKAGSGQ